MSGTERWEGLEMGTGWEGDGKRSRMGKGWGQGQDGEGMGTGRGQFQEEDGGKRTGVFEAGWGGDGGKEAELWGGRDIGI